MFDGKDIDRSRDILRCNPVDVDGACARSAEDCRRAKATAEEALDSSRSDMHG